MSSERKRQDVLMEMYWGCCQTQFHDIIRRHQGRRILLIFDPPYNIKYPRYDGYRDNLPLEKYIDLIKMFRGYPSIVIQYPELMQKLVAPALGQPSRWLNWCYKNTCARGFRVIGFWNVTPDFEQVRFGFSENSKDYEIRVNNTGRCTRFSFDWWADIPQLRKNCIERRGNPHPCPLPKLLVKRIIALCAHQGDLIIDPFAGSFTTALAAHYFGLDFAGVEMSKQYLRYGYERIQQECGIAPRICSGDGIESISDRAIAG